MLAIIIVVIIFVTVNHSEAKRMIKCPKWRYHFLDIPIKGKPECKPCTLCKPGYRQVTHCTKVNDTHCKRCRRGTYSSNNSKRCRPCKHCWQGAKIRRKCTNIEKAQCECPKGKYYKTGKCIPCTKCLPGTYMTSQCSFRRNTQCMQCPEGTYTSTRTTHTLPYCALCSECRLGELITHKCNATQDTVCGECRPGLFRQTSSNECAPCSLCYPDVNGSYASAIIVDECRRWNPDQSRICMPDDTTLPVYIRNSTASSKCIDIGVGRIVSSRFNTSLTTAAETYQYHYLGRSRLQ